MTAAATITTEAAKMRGRRLKNRPLPGSRSIILKEVIWWQAHPSMQTIETVVRGLCKARCLYDGKPDLVAMIEEWVTAIEI